MVKRYKRIPWGREKRGAKDFADMARDMPIGDRSCPDCGVAWGKLHDSDWTSPHGRNRSGLCDVEECPICGRQLMTCGHAIVIFPKLNVIK